MREREPTTQTMSASDASRTFDQILVQVSNQETRVVVEENGEAVVAIISAKDMDRLSRYEHQRKQEFAILDEIGTAFQDVPLEELEAEVAKAVIGAREDVRREQAARGSA